jgi:prepilin-type N-terminal cleavage/methylation domain-containing protein
MKLTQNRRRVAGFTLIEMLVAITVAGILMAIAMPRFYAFLPGIRLASAARQVATDLQLARMKAISTRAAQTVAFVPPSGVYTFGANNRDLNQLYPGTTILSVTGGNPTFNTVGAANAATTITLRNNGIDRTVLVNVAGRVFTQ